MKFVNHLCLILLCKLNKKPLSFYKETKILLEIEIRKEWRLKTGIVGIFLHIISAIFICYLSFSSIPAVTKNPLFWLIILFTTIHGISKGFMEESKGYKMYINQMASPTSIIASKLIYNIALMVLLTSITLFFYFFFIGLKPMSTINYFISILLSVIGIAVVFTMVSAIASNASKPGMLIPILNLPLVLPIILIGLKATERAMTLKESTEIYKDWFILAALAIMISISTIILFKFLRKE